VGEPVDPGIDAAAQPVGGPRAGQVDGEVGGPGNPGEAVAAGGPAPGVGERAVDEGGESGHRLGHGGLHRDLVGAQGAAGSEARAGPGEVPLPRAVRRVLGRATTPTPTAYGTASATGGG